MQPRRALVVLTAVVLAGGVVLSGQSPAADTNWTFDVASVRPNRDVADDSYVRRQPGGRFNAVNMPLRTLISFAHQVQGFQLLGVPEWAADERFDIVAKLNADPAAFRPGSGPDPHMVALRALLAERFKLATRRETRELDIYALVTARADGQLGPALKPANDECQRMMDAVSKGAQPPSGPGTPFCGMRMNRGRVQSGGFPLSQLANGLSGQVGRYVADRTGLGGVWDFELTFAPEPPRGPQPASVDMPSGDTNAPSLFTALQEQLGLRLDAIKGPVDVVVVDRVERPVPD